MVDAVGTTAYSYTVGGQLSAEHGPWASDTVTNFYSDRLRTNLSLAQPTGKWTNGFAWDQATWFVNIAISAWACWLG